MLLARPYSDEYMIRIPSESNHLETAGITRNEFESIIFSYTGQTPERLSVEHPEHGTINFFESLNSTIYLEWHPFENTLGAWKNHYIEFINDNPPYNDMRWTDFSLVNIAQGSTPELIINYSSNALGSVILTLSNGNLGTLSFSGSVRYIENENLFLVSGGRMDFYYDRLYRIENGNFYLQDEGIWTTFSGERLFYWNDEEVSEADYELLLKTVFDISRARWAHETNNFDSHEIINRIIEW